MYNEQQRAELLIVAKTSIWHGLNHGKPLLPALENYDPELREYRASFVTLHKQGQLRGCIGSLKALRPLVEDICENAYAAAFNDPRFPALQQAELEELEISISVLTPASEMSFESEQDLLEQIRPGVDGLIMQEGNRRGTFLPSVWEQLPDPVEFLQHLKLKTGLSMDYWSDTIRVSCYQTESF